MAPCPLPISGCDEGDVPESDGEDEDDAPEGACGEDDEDEDECRRGPAEWEPDNDEKDDDISRRPTASNGNTSASSSPRSTSREDASLRGSVAAACEEEVTRDGLDTPGGGRSRTVEAETETETGVVLV